MTSKEYIAATNAAISKEIARITAEMERSADPVLQIAKYGEPAFIRPHRKEKGVR